ncbi:calcitonin gene-related peptide type 1 receptor-like isoform X1 [Centruroides sculpturatus]|uniref:calcitonin gene-related peptide type 1 receptor-like isoform X1 n=2 Tax=Centruroides sculpturatus TaxID=218467 RepID=UPI000C6D3F5C|nr:calcitonin gene-related peptide type 1 receptor-like isoform X1 [Centruroides sculpturatus]XP_023223413.1 calcitonin gene-related peptide type 1 receptor-like isoform X1 [Centruroides sculpturatus]
MGQLYLSTLYFALVNQIVLHLIHADLEGANQSTLEYSNVYCRTERRVELNYIFYRYDTCARCYDYLPDWIFPNMSLKFVYKGNGYLYNPEDNTPYLPDPSNTSCPIVLTFISEEFIKKWAECCQAALDCCEEMAKATKPNEETYCPRTWDGWQCWPDTQAGTIAIAPCARHIYFKSEQPACPRFAMKECWPNGTWYVNDEYNNEWTNYGNCGRVAEVRRLLYFHIVTYAISIIFLIPALIIFTMYKQLQVHRITMHKHLFASLLLNGIFVILFKSIVMLNELNTTSEENTILEANGVGCKILFVLTKYFRMTNYMWMLCEGFYLHKLIAAAFAEQKSLIMFYLIGWAFPAIPICIYALLRKIYSDVRCWAIPEETYEWIMNTPNLISLLLNLAFLFNIIRVLVTKLRATHANEPSQYRKAVRATLILVPLFGVHFTLVIYRPQSGKCEFLEAYTYFSHAMDGLQGMIVAVIFCYANGEIQTVIWRSLQRYRLQQKFTSTSGGRRTARTEMTKNEYLAGGLFAEKVVPEVQTTSRFTKQKLEQFHNETGVNVDSYVNYRRNSIAEKSP